ncbi:hypothetical protein I8752_11020 [Nostocaceae cyanobacterium CENA369]|uniref:Uncharacterized protein n=1 Tax=Dendronalium phyllosphericum CENA369 TaxID=1725256 RepID=A0A8J7I068_9NOST|nr:hypothetical protein [Dendronalium phyllosphericum]MBH8573539.1 hypothetical protein [Dendronalium phyllosphericum CENA369]
MAVPLTDLKIGQPVKYLIGTRNGLTAKVTDIRKCSMSIKDTHVVTLTFDDDSLPPHLKTQEITAYNGIVEGCEIEF